MKPEAHIRTEVYNAEHPVLANPGETTLMPHMPQLDGVRALAVLSVIWWHFMPAAAKTGGVAPWGAIGVGVFFTLSGFLITRILLSCKLKIDARRAGFGQMMKQFYVRRFLRIFPLYYGTLALLFVFDPYTRSRLLWNVTYLTNVRFSYWVRERGGPPEHERHLWSLSVEEQFYLLWPLLIFLVPRRWLLPLIALTVLAAPVWRVLSYTRGQFAHEFMMPGCLDLLGMGALLALLSVPQFGWSRWWNGFVETCGLIGVPLFLVYVTAKSIAASGDVATSTFFGVESVAHLRRGWVGMGFEWPGGATYPITALFAVWLIGTAARGFRGPFGYLLSSPPLVYIGRISYGLYVLHMLVPPVVGYFFPAFVKQAGWTQLLTYFAISVVCASASWYLFEAPINRLKKYFEYDGRSAPTTATLTAEGAVPVQKA